MTVRFQRETLDEWLADARFILESHAQEAGETLGDTLNFNHDLYVELDQQKCLYVITGRNEHNELVAYWFGTFIPNLYFKQFMTAYAVAYWVRKDYRGFTVVRFIKFIDKYFKKLGATNIIQSTRVQNRMGSILEKMGYCKFEETYKKVL